MLAPQPGALGSGPCIHTAGAEPQDRSAGTAEVPHLQRAAQRHGRAHGAGSWQLPPQQLPSPCPSPLGAAVPC